MTEFTSGAAAAMTIGIDIGDRTSQVCILDDHGAVIEEAKLATTPDAIRRRFGSMPRSRIAMETSTQAAWIDRLLVECGHEVIVANPRKLSLISKSLKKSDRNDAETLARVARMDPQLLSPIRHRGPRAQRDLSTLTSRDALVAARTQLVCHVRSSVKAVGSRLPSTSAESFPSKVREAIPVELRAGLDLILDVIETLTEKIRVFDRAVEDACENAYPETKLLRQVSGVGPITALSFVLTIEDPHRFQKSRAVGSYIGLTPRTYESGQKDPELRISKAGDATLRRLLVGAAHYILGPFGPDTDLRRFGLVLASRGRKNAKKRAVVAVARKLAVLLHHLWRSGEVYEPLRNQKERGQTSGVVSNIAAMKAVTYEGANLTPTQ